jgi:hypothetical protein
MIQNAFFMVFREDITPHERVRGEIELRLKFRDQGLVRFANALHAPAQYDARSILRFLVYVVDHDDGQGTLLLHYL